MGSYQRDPVPSPFPRMTHRVFISYASQDNAVANRVCSGLEKAGFACWIAPRDIDAGTGFPGTIVHAIEATEALVVLLTEHAVISPHVLSEVGHAFNENKRILPVMLSPLEMPPDFGYFLAHRQWLTASEGFDDETLKRLIEAVSSLLSGTTDTGPDRPPKNKTALVAGLVATALLGLAGVFWYQRLSIPLNPAPVAPVAGSTATPSANRTTVAPDSTNGSNHGSEPSKPRIWTNSKDGQRYVFVAPGVFSMGCSPADSECESDEKPTRRVEITTGFWLAQMEVTNATYSSVVKKPIDKSKDPGLPIYGLNWLDAKAYCVATGGRLPTEAEWEFAARAGSSEPYYGSPSRIAWYETNSEHSPHPGGLKQPNAFGLYDMLGNVSEWVLDRYFNQYDREADATGPAVIQPLQGNAIAVTRGGYWDSGLSRIRVSQRTEMEPDQDGPAGVRCANDHRGT